MTRDTQQIIIVFIANITGVPDIFPNQTIKKKQEQNLLK